MQMQLHVMPDLIRHLMCKFKTVDQMESDEILKADYFVQYVFSIVSINASHSRFRMNDKQEFY